MNHAVITIRYPNRAAFSTVDRRFVFWTFAHFLGRAVAGAGQAHAGVSLRMAYGLLFVQVALLNVIKIGLIYAICVAEGDASSFWRHVTL